MVVESLSLKVFGIFFIWVVGLVSGLLPIKIQNILPDVIPISESFAAGIFLGGGMLHLLSDSSQELSRNHDYPLGFLLSILCFSFLFLLEKTIIPTLLLGLKKRPSSKYIELSQQKGNKILIDEIVEEGSTKKENSLDQENVENKKTFNHTIAHSPHSHPHSHSHSQLTYTIEQFSDQNTVGGKVILFVLLFALIFHSILAGISFGVVDHEKAIIIFLAIISHKGCAGFSLGTTFTKNYQSTKKYFFISILLFSLSTPFGILVGFFLDGLSDSDLINSIIAFTSGSFLYISFIQLFESFDGKKHVQKSLSFILGLAIMSAITLLE
ncbi:zinc transporter zip1 [Anaeramoeba flamelloides]|uniref:Zinc transporter zip1 n=1 Tax=Anaeramoeba flamelloides TaxID=1746091 RepID=A0AAV7Z8E2_9EUKA|nr:zinc transporter zip1 [Anaeramoeba flamelloides]